MPNDTATLARTPDLIPKQHHLDRRAADIAKHGAGDPHDLLSTMQVAIWLGVSVQFLEIGRHRGYGPRFVKLSPRRTKYLRSAVIEWLAERSHASTAEYGTGAVGRKAGSKVVAGRVVVPEAADAAE